MLHTLMLAQGQECFYEKATMDGMKSGILAKLAMQISVYYTDIDAILRGDAYEVYVDSFVLSFRIIIIHHQHSSSSRCVQKINKSNRS
mgnify:CR=1 FL=1